MENPQQSPIARRLTERLAALGKTQRGASIEAGFSASVIRNIMEGKSQSPRGKTLSRLAEVLECDVEWLLHGAPSSAAGARRVPLISWVSAGRPEAPDSVTDLDGCEILEMSGLPDGDWFALNVEGDSMDRISPPGSVIVANRRERQLVPNACYVIALEDGSATYKRYRASPSRFEPVSINPAHEAIFPDGAVRVIGRVRRSILEM